MSKIPKPVIIDCDPGIDDAAALFMALASSALDIKALTTVFGNVSVEQTTVNALKILEASGRSDIPVYKGAGNTFDFRKPHYAQHIHGEDGLGNTSFPDPITNVQSKHAVNATIEIVMENPGEVVYVALGRLTNLALAINMEPDLVKNISEVVVMGGAINVPGNSTPVASANLYGDVLAASIIYDSGLKIAQIGLDVCNKVEITVEEQEKVWALNSQVSNFLKEVTPFIRTAYGKIANKNWKMANEGAVRYNDMPAIGYTIDNSLFGCEELKVIIETQGQYTKGQTINGSHRDYIEDANVVNVALEVDDVNLKKLWISEISSYS
jgi:inosine-uridine nucleoside N-ribohydrolase